MSQIKLARVDSRLIHGQVMTRWVMDLKINKIIVVDDSTFKNAILSRVLKMAAPVGVEVELYDVESGITALSNFNEKDSILLLFKDVFTASKLIDNGVKFSELQIGGVGGGPERKKVYKNVSLTIEEYDVLAKLSEKDVQVYFQPIPEDKPCYITTVSRDNLL